MSRTQSRPLMTNTAGLFLVGVLAMALTSIPARGDNNGSSSRHKLDRLLQQVVKGNVTERLQVIVGLKADVRPTLKSDLQAMGATVVNEMPLTRSLVVTVAGNKLERLAADPDVERISSDGPVHAMPSRVTSPRSP